MINMIITITGSINIITMIRPVVKADDSVSSEPARHPYPGQTDEETLPNQKPKDKDTAKYKRTQRKQPKAKNQNQCKQPQTYPHSGSILQMSPLTLGR